jgi:hypothetical protein
MRASAGQTNPPTTTASPSTWTTARCGLLTTIDYQAAGIARVRSSYLVQAVFSLFLQHEGRRHDPAIDDVALEAYQQRELDRVAQTIVTSIAAVAHRLRSIAGNRRVAGRARLPSSIRDQPFARRRPTARSISRPLCEARHFVTQ